MTRSTDLPAFTFGAVEPTNPDEGFTPWSIQPSRRFPMRETYWITHDAARTIRHFIKFRKKQGEQFPSRIMLAVTEVNGCAMCAYAHTKFALEGGMDSDEVRNLLGGVTDGAPDVELPAIGFAQHYADSKARPDRDAWDRLVEIYGDEDALGTLGTIRMMMWGNAVGIPLSSMRARLKGEPHPDSSLRSEVKDIVGSWAALPFAAIHGGISALVGKPLISFPTPTD